MGFPLAALYKFFDDFGSYLAALLTYYGFVSLFPLLLLASTILGFVLSGDPRLENEVLTSALSQFPVIGPDLGLAEHLGGGTVGLVVGIAGCLYGGLGVAQAFQYAANSHVGLVDMAPAIAMCNRPFASARSVPGVTCRCSVARRAVGVCRGSATISAPPPAC